MDKLANMQAFEAVATSGSFAEAARKLAIANSVVSKRVKDLEDFLGVELFIRTTRKVTLTETGQSYLDYVSRILADINDVESRIQNKRDKPAGTIKLAAPLSFGVQYLGSAISSYLDKYPDVTIQTFLSDRQVSLIDEGYDVSIRIGQLKDSTLIARKLGISRRVVCASPDYFEQFGRPETPAELKTHNCLSYINIADGKAWPFTVNEQKHWQQVTGSFQSDNGDLLHQAALAGCGISQLPTFIVADALRSGELETVLQPYEEELGIYAVYQQTRHLSTKIRTLLDHLTDCFKKIEI